MQVDVTLQPKQEQLLDLIEESPATWIGYGGSRGGAKSHAIQAIMVIRRFKYAGTKGCIFRRTYEKVKENHIDPILARYPFMRGWYHAQDKEIRFPNGSVIAFRYGETKKDIDDFIGKQYMDVFADQAEMLTELELNTLKSCTRWPGVKDTACKFLLAFNPGNVGHKFLKRIFYDGPNDHSQYRPLERPQDYAFLQAFGWDNVEWGRIQLEESGVSVTDYYAWSEEQRFEYFVNHTQYGRELNALPESLRIGWLMGSMEKFSGQYFDCITSANIKAPQELGIEAWFPRWISIDWGFAHPSAIYWHAKDGDRVLTYRELVVAGKLDPNTTTEEVMLSGEYKLGERIAELSNADKDSTGKPYQISTVYLSPDAFAQRTSANTVAQQIGSALAAHGLPQPVMADNDRIGGARLCHGMLKQGLAVISTACPKLLECLPMLVHEDGNEEDVLKIDGDDPYDAWRYGLKSKLGSKDVPFEVVLNTYAKAVEDPTSRAIFVQKILSEHKQSRKGVGNTHGRLRWMRN